jgi:hypothetical protein
MQATVAQHCTPTLPTCAASLSQLKLNFHFNSITNIAELLLFCQLSSFTDTLMTQGVADLSQYTLSRSPQCGQTAPTKEKTLCLIN